MECLRILCAQLLDILKLYLKFGIITLVIYFMAEWYVLHYEDLDALPVNAMPQPAPPNNSTVNKIFRFALNFFLA